MGNKLTDKTQFGKERMGGFAAFVHLTRFLSRVTIFAVLSRLEVSMGILSAMTLTEEEITDGWRIETINGCEVKILHNESLKSFMTDTTTFVDPFRRSRRNLALATAAIFLAFFILAMLCAIFLSMKQRGMSSHSNILDDHPQLDA